MASSTKTDQQDEQLQVKVLEFAEAFMSYDVDRLMGILSGDYRANDNRKASVACVLRLQAVCPLLHLSLSTYRDSFPCLCVAIRSASEFAFSTRILHF